MRSLTLSDPKSMLDIRPHAEALEALANDGGFLLWHRDGMVGKIPNVVLRDIVTVYLAYETLRQRGRITELPAAAYSLHWSQASDVRSEVNCPKRTGR